MNLRHDARPQPRRETAPSPPGVGTRLFVYCSVLAIVVRSALNTFMHHVTWRDELDMFTLPYPLPAAAERAQLDALTGAAGEDNAQPRPGRHSSLSERLAAVGASVLRFASPLPRNKTAQRLDGPHAWLKYAAVWTHTRLEFVGRLIGVDERWTMFSPTVGTARNVVRAVLSYADGTDVTVRSLVEPDDLTTFVRPFAQRRLQHDINLTQLEHVRLSWCRYLARTRASGPGGAPLQSIGLYQVRHPLAPPHVSATEHWRAENTRALPPTPAWRFDVTTDLLEETRADSDRIEATDDGE